MATFKGMSGARLSGRIVLMGEMFAREIPVCWFS
jgi:hypothetical protein